MCALLYMYCCILFNGDWFRVDATLREHEMKEEFDRWSIDSDMFKDMKRLAEEERKEKILENISTCARERWFLLNLKAKFAGNVHLTIVTLSSLSESLWL